MLDSCSTIMRLRADLDALGVHHGRINGGNGWLQDVKDMEVKELNGGYGSIETGFAIKGFSWGIAKNHGGSGDIETSCVLTGFSMCAT